MFGSPSLLSGPFRSKSKWFSREEVDLDWHGPGRSFLKIDWCGSSPSVMGMLLVAILDTMCIFVYSLSNMMRSFFCKDLVDFLNLLASVGHCSHTDSLGHSSWNSKRWWSLTWHWCYDINIYIIITVGSYDVHMIGDSKISLCQPTRHRLLCLRDAHARRGKSNCRQGHCS